MAVDRILDDPPPPRRKPRTGFVSVEPFAQRADELLAKGFGE